MESMCMTWACQLDSPSWQFNDGVLLPALITAVTGGGIIAVSDKAATHIGELRTSFQLVRLVVCGLYRAILQITNMSDRNVLSGTQQQSWSSVTVCLTRWPDRGQGLTADDTGTTGAPSIIRTTLQGRWPSKSHCYTHWLCGLIVDINHGIKSIRAGDNGLDCIHVTERAASRSIALGNTAIFPMGRKVLYAYCAVNYC